jgi:hypothetical protein
MAFPVRPLYVKINARLGRNFEVIVDAAANR